MNFKLSYNSIFKFTGKNAPTLKVNSRNIVEIHTYDFKF